MARFKKYSQHMADEIAELIRADTYTIDEICSMAHISKKTFYNWQNEHPEFSEAINEARATLREIVAIKAKKSLIKKIEGYNVTETSIVSVPGKNGKPQIKEQKTIKRYIQPDTAAIIFALTNTDADNWRNRHNTEITGKDGKDLFASKTDEELEAEIKELQRKLE